MQTENQGRSLTECCSIGKIVSVGSDCGLKISTTTRTNLGRTHERIRTVARDSDLPIGGCDKSGVQCQLLFEADTNEDDFRRVETSVKADVNGCISSLYGILGAIDSARKRQVWLGQLGLPYNTPEMI